MISVDALREQLDSDDRVLLLDVRPATDFNSEWGCVIRPMPVRDSGILRYAIPEMSGTRFRN
jgi:hypothetical protein